ncbi:MAG: MBL fold metallo-hydrolase [Bacteroidetes bacterium]|jgi:hydroxyacylglutathione hydrolase|nr:MBL fold metallo-hydrolase [Bacteroidota bacterium]MDA0972406.1 MBL fold metallo-hydrolase [Bacteroidota bacterium]
MRIEHFTFNAFAENTYLLIGESKDTILIDPGMMDPQEEQQLFTFISEENLRPIRSMNTHCHIDHVLGIHAVNKQYSLSPEFHLKEQMVFDSCERVAQMYGIPYLAYTGQVRSLDVGDTIDLDGEELELRFVPGHSPGHLVFISHTSKAVIAGDTLFRGSIGRTDLPGGEHDLLLESIRNEMYSLPEDYTVWPGHGPRTTIGWEKKNNPFVRA